MVGSGRDASAVADDCEAPDGGSVLGLSGFRVERGAAVELRMGSGMPASSVVLLRVVMQARGEDEGSECQIGVFEKADRATRRRRRGWLNMMAIGVRGRWRVTVARGWG
jgi:hypothetical protein